MSQQIEIKQEVKVRILSFTSFRHYGGREIKATPNICNATLVAIQRGDQPYIVELLQAGAGLPKGHIIAISEKDFNL